jgi:sialic acid synthase SpsE
MAKIKLNNQMIGHECDPFIIAEAGINHNGKIENALKMIDVAKVSGADAIKFQTFEASGIVADSSLTYTYKSQGKEVTESMFEMFKRYEFSKTEWIKIKQKCDESEILFLSTPENRSDLDLLLELGIPAIKIGSDDFTNIPLLKDFSTTGLPLIISCGMANLSEIQQTLKAIGSLENYPTILMLTTSEYPTISSDVNLSKFKTLSKSFPNIILGYSDHTQGVLASSIAVAFGAKVFEKHFTLDKNLPGPDHWFSEDADGLKNWVDSIRTANIMLGSEEVQPTEKEEKMKILARRSVVALCDIKQGELFTQNNIGLRRPGNGLPAIMIEEMHGKKSTKKISKGDLLKIDDFL